MEQPTFAYAYARVSSEAQAEKGTSIPSQLELIRTYAKNNNIKIVQEFVDEAESATTDLRPQFQEMIALCKENPQGISAILVWKLSRFARNRIDSVVYKKLLSKQDIRVISISEPIDDTPEGRILEGMIEIIDSYYSEILSRESMRGLKQTAQQGFHCGGPPPYGYRLVKVQAGSATKTSWEIEPREAEAVRIIYQMHSEGFTYNDIMSRLNTEGYKPRQRSEWARSSISDILRKECYSGRHFFNTRKRKELGKKLNFRKQKDKSEWIEIQVPQIVDDDIFTAVKEKMKRRQFKSPSTRRKTDQVLPGLLICGKCNEPYVIGDYYKGKYPYYRCSTKMKKGVSACDNRNLRGDEVDEVVLREASKLIFSKSNLQRYKKLIDDTLKEEKREYEQKLKAIEKELRQVGQKKRTYFNGIENGKLSIELVQERLEELQTDEKILVSRKAEIEGELVRLPETQNYALSDKEFEELNDDLNSFLEEASPRQKRQFLSNFIKGVTVYPEKLVVEYFPPVFQKKKNPATAGNGRQGLSVIDLAVPTGLEPVSSA